VNAEERAYDFFVETTSGERFGVCLVEDRAAFYNDRDALAFMLPNDLDEIRRVGRIVGGSPLMRARLALDAGLSV
jgi:hypothetical protein